MSEEQIDSAFPKKVPIIKKKPIPTGNIDLFINYDKSLASKKWKEANKERIQAMNFCYRNGIDWNEYKVENGFDKPYPPSNKRIEHTFDVNGNELKYCSHCSAFIPITDFSYCPKDKAWDELRPYCKRYDKEYKEKTKQPYTLVICTECDKEVEQGYLKEHMQKVHRPIEETYNTQCPTCLIVFKSEDTYKRHLATEKHTTITKAIQLRNEKIAETKKLLSDAIRNGSDEISLTTNNNKKKPIVIKKINNEPSDQPILDSTYEAVNTTVLSDNKKKPMIVKKIDIGLNHNESDNPQKSEYKCELCPYTGDDKHRLSAHIKRVHGDRVHICTYVMEDNKVCNQSFTRKDHLDRHVKSVHDRTTFKCAYCNKEVVMRDKSRHLDGCAKKMAMQIYPGASKWEKMVFKFCIENKIKVQPQKKYTDLRKKQLLPYDFLFEDKLLVETHGNQHYTPTSYSGAAEKFQETIENDRLKKEYAEKNNIDLFIIDTRVHNTYEKICKVLADKLGIVPVISSMTFDLYVD